MACLAEDLQRRIEARTSPAPQAAGDGIVDDAYTMEVVRDNFKASRSKRL
jgi:hypothetical protein